MSKTDHYEVALLLAVARGDKLMAWAMAMEEGEQLSLSGNSSAGRV